MHLILPALLLATVAFVTSAAASPVERQVPDSVLLRLRDHDAALGEVAWRLATANAALCEDRIPATGAVLHARNQYSDAIAPQVERVYGFAGSIAIAAVVPGSQADRAGLLAGDTVLAVSGIVPPTADSDGEPDTRVRDEFETRLAGLPPAAAMAWQIQRRGQNLLLQLQPQPACRVRFELVPGQRLIARNTGELVQLSAGYLDLLDPGSVAAAVAHELAHSVLLHRSRLVAAGVAKGLLAEFGRNGRLNRQIEREADALSVHLLRNAGFDPDFAVQLWKRHGGRIAGGLFRSRTHDSPEERIRRIQAEIAAIPEAAPIPYAPDWLHRRHDPLR